LTVFLLWRFGILTRPDLRYKVMVPGLYFKDNTIWYFLLKGSTALAIGSLLFFSKKPVQFIAPNVVTQKQDETVEQGSAPQCNSIDD
jgi:hypothetical protein